MGAVCPSRVSTGQVMAEGLNSMSRSTRDSVRRRASLLATTSFVAASVLGAAGGAAINFAFMDHFQSLAKGHFTVRRLERIYGPEPVRAEYQRISSAHEPDEIQPPAA